MTDFDRRTTIPPGMREQVEGISYRQFAALAKIMRWTAEELAIEFRGIAEREPAASYFARVLRGDPDWNVVIPFRSVIAKYVKAATHLIADGRLRACACGCGSPVFGRDRLTWPGCKALSRNGRKGREAGVPIS